MRRHRLILFTILAIGTFILGLEFQSAKRAAEPSLEALKKSVADTVVKTAEKYVSLPAPLISHGTSELSSLTKSGILKFTNAARATTGLSALSEDPKLDEIARLRAADMFKYQYFSHDSPSGKTAQALAIDVGYSYISLGENIALGTFESDKALVNAWMASPGHRANILNAHYREIGISALKGTYEGRTVWISAQIFGRELSDCPGPDSSLKSSIDSANEEINILSAQAEALQKELETMPHRTRDEVRAYNEKVDEYNTIVAKIKIISENAKSLVAAYNSQAQSFNACLQQ